MLNAGCGVIIRSIDPLTYDRLVKIELDRNLQSICSQMYQNQHRILNRHSCHGEQSFSANTNAEGKKKKKQDVLTRNAVDCV